jgi:hypothetical protein
LSGHGHPHAHDEAHDHGGEHVHRHDEAGTANQEELKAIEAAFIAGFRDAPDKQAFLRLAGIPLSLERPGKTALKLIEVRLADTYRVGSASPGFATRELSYQPLPAALLEQSTALAFIYVAVDAVIEKTLGAVMSRGEPH